MARDCGAEIVVVECSPAPRHTRTQDDSDSEDEGWYSLSRTDVRKLQEVRGRQDVNIILTNPDIDILHLCAEDVEEEDLDGEDERKQESSPERTSYSSLSSGDSGQGSDGSKPSSRKSSDPGSSGCSCSASSEPDQSSDTSCDNEDSCAHKITVFVKYNEGATVPALVEGCVDSEGEGEAGGGSGGGDTVVTCDTRGDTITICDTRVRLRLCPAPAPHPGQDTELGPGERLQEHSNSGNSSMVEHTSNSGNSSMVEHNCGNNKCIMCGPAPPQRTQETT